MSATNGGPAPQTGMAQMPMPQIGVRTQYVKDFHLKYKRAALFDGAEHAATGHQHQYRGRYHAPDQRDIEVMLRLDGKANRKAC